jgi:hypothetical protein
LLPSMAPTNQPTALNYMQLFVQVVSSPCGFRNYDTVSEWITGTATVYAGDVSSCLNCQLIGVRLCLGLRQYVEG